MLAFFRFHSTHACRKDTLYGYVNDKDDEDELYDGEEEFLKKWITIQEDFEIYRNNNILDIITKFEDYKKISRFNKDKEYMNIRD